MRVDALTWQAIEDYLAHDDRVVIPIGSTEQHGYLRLGTDSVIAERLALEAAQPLGVAVLPVLPYGHTPLFAAYPGSPSLRPETLGAVLDDLLTTLHEQGFRRFMILNGHSGNLAAGAAVERWTTRSERASVDFWTWFFDPDVDAFARTLAPDPSHANWLESAPWTRVAGVEAPVPAKPLTRHAELLDRTPAQVRKLLADGSYGGEYRRSDAEWERLWSFAVERARARLSTLGRG